VAPTVGLEPGVECTKRDIATESASCTLRTKQFEAQDVKRGRKIIQSVTASADTVEAALMVALTEAAKAGRFDVVSQLAKELESRRLASSPNVVTLDTSKRGAK
jgi:hypothetical protein